jgi:hypothetical protein
VSFDFKLKHCTGTNDVEFRLTLGLMGLDELHLRVLAASSDDPVEKRNAVKGSEGWLNYSTIRA